MQGVCEQQFSSLATGAQQDLSRAVCLRSNLLPILKSFAAFNRFSSRFAPCLHPSIFPSALSSFPFPAGEKCAHSMMLPPPCFTAGIVFSNQCLFCIKAQRFNFGLIWPGHLCCVPFMAYGRLLMAFFQQWPLSWRSSITARFGESRFSHLSISAAPLELTWASWLLLWLKLFDWPASLL